MRDYKLYLKDILAAIDSIERFVAGMNVAIFQTDDKTTSSVRPPSRYQMRYDRNILSFHGKKW